MNLHSNSEYTIYEYPQFFKNLARTVHGLKKKKLKEGLFSDTHGNWYASHHQSIWWGILLYESEIHKKCGDAAATVRAAPHMAILLCMPRSMGKSILTLKNTAWLLRTIIHRFGLNVNCKKLGHRDSKHLANLFNGIYRKLAASAARDAKRRVGDVSALA